MTRTVKRPKKLATWTPVPDLGWAFLEWWNEDSTWHFVRLHLVCGCSVTFSGLLRKPGELYGFWSSLCTVDPAEWSAAGAWWRRGPPTGTGNGAARRAARHAARSRADGRSAHAAQSMVLTAAVSRV